VDLTNRQVWRKVGWTAGLVLLLVLLLMSVNRKKNAVVDDIVININPIKGNRDLISETEILHLFKNSLGFAVGSASIQELDLRSLEELLTRDERVKESELYLDSKNRLNVFVIQRQPVVRIMEESSHSYYLDTDGMKLSVRPGNAIRVPVATGYIEFFQSDFRDSEKHVALNRVFQMAMSIHEDEFLGALVEQIDVNPKKEIVLIPKIGKQRIVIGDVDFIDQKISNLKLMYREGLPREGWRKYSVLKLNYKGAVYAEL
jgi:cell division protein FtsQ